MKYNKSGQTQLQHYKEKQKRKEKVKLMVPDSAITLLQRAPASRKLGVGLCCDSCFVHI